MAYKRKFVKKSKKGMKKRRNAPMKRAKLVSLIKRTVIKKAEPKERQTAVAKTELFHNALSPGGYIVHLNNAQFLPTQGVADNQRVGDEINCTGFKIKMLIGQKADRPNVTFQYYILKLPKGATIDYSNWFGPNPTNNVLLDEPNDDFCKVLGRGTWRPNEAGLGGTGGDEYTFAKKLWIPYRKLLKFGPASGATTHNDDDIYFIMMCYDAFGSVGSTDNIAYVQSLVCFFYRDP